MIQTTKYKMLLDKMLEDISKMQDGDRLPFVRDMMKSYGVSQSTLDKCLVELENSGAIKRLPARGIFVSKSDSRHCDKLVGIIVPDVADKNAYTIIRGIEDALGKESSSAFVCSTYRHMPKEFAFVNILKQKNVDGLIIAPASEYVGYPDYIAVLQEIEEHDTPLVILDVQLPGLRSDFLGLDSFGCFRNIGRTILSQRNDIDSFLFVSKQASVPGFERVNGFNAALRESDRSFRYETVGGFEDRAYAKKVVAKIRDEGFQCVVIVFPEAVAPICFEIEKAGIDVPSDLLVLGTVYDDYRAAIDIPIIAAVKTNYELGSEAASVLLRRMDGDTRKKSEAVQARIQMKVIYSDVLDISDDMHVGDASSAVLPTPNMK